MHKSIGTHARARTYTQITHTRMYIYMHTRIDVDTYTRTQIHKNTCEHMYTRARARA